MMAEPRETPFNLGRADHYFRHGPFSFLGSTEGKHLGKKWRGVGFVHSWSDVQILSRLPSKNRSRLISRRLWKSLPDAFDFRHERRHLGSRRTNALAG